MQSLTQISPEYLSHISKLDQLLRFYQIAKKTEKFSQVGDKTRSKIHSILASLQTFTYFKQIQEDVVAKIEKTFEPAKAKSSVKSSRNPSVKFSDQVIEHSKDSSSNSSGSMGGSERVKATEKKQSSPIKKAASNVIQITPEPPSPSSSQSAPSFNAQTPQPKAKPQPPPQPQPKTQPKIKEPSPPPKEKPSATPVFKNKVEVPAESMSMKFQVRNVDLSQKEKSVKVEEKVPEKPISSAMKLIEEPSQKKEEKNKSNDGMIEVISFDIQSSNIFESGDSGKISDSSNSNSNSNSNPNIHEESNSLQKSKDNIISIGNSSMNQNKVASLSSIKSTPQQSKESSESQIGIIQCESVLSVDKKDKDDDVISNASQKISEISSNEEVIDVVVKYFTENRDRLNFCLVFNYQLFDQLDQHLDDHFYLFGINKPDSRRIQELYGCTMMKFLIAELTKGDNKFEKEMKDFNNNIRIPLGLIFKGKGPEAIMPQHIKFLQTVQSPFPVILVFKDDTLEKGNICSFHDSILERIRITPRKQLGQCIEELRKKTVTLPYNEQHCPNEKHKIMTKYLPRVIPNLAEEAPNAITISGNDCIKEQKNCFLYKLHTKYLQLLKTDLAIYYVNKNVVNTRIVFKDKDFQNFKKEVLENQSKIPMILSIGLNKENAFIRKDFFQLLFESRGKRDLFFFMTTSNLVLKKTIILALRADATAEDLNKYEPMQFKQFQKDTFLTTTFHVVSKTNIKDFEVSDGKVDLVEIKNK